MRFVPPDILEILWHDWDLRETRLREVVSERLAERPAPASGDHITASYFYALRTTTLRQAADEIVYHATSGARRPPAGSLLAECTGVLAGLDPFDAGERMGLVHMAFPLKMLLQAGGHLTSVDLLHTLAGAVIFDVYENLDARLVAIDIPETVLRTFPGPAHGPQGVRRLTRFPPDEPAFGTILKPTAGITPDDVGRLMAEVARCPLFLFVKEDENLYPRLGYSPAAERTRRAVEAIRRTRDQRGGRGLLFAPHITGSPNELVDTLHAVLEAGAQGVMFSETFCGGTVRMVREATKGLANPPAIYGHNAGIGVKTRGIWREVLDFLARLDGIDFRQTAPLRPGQPFIRPYGAEWRASEEVLTRPLPSIKPTMIARAGALDQGNIGPNLAEVEARGLVGGILFLAGSAINSIKNAAGQADPLLGSEAMQQALDVHRTEELAGVALEEHLAALMAVAERRGLAALREALRQRYPAA
jgi:ribulose 1,5-bisphosphate carboxylase large subunit-like protein